MEEAVWICEEPEAKVSFYGQSPEALRSSGYAPHQPGLTSLSPFIYYLFISFNQLKKKFTMSNWCVFGLELKIKII